MTGSAPFPPTPTAGWKDPGQVEWYLDRVGVLPARLAGEDALKDRLPPAPRTLLDLGCGDGRLTVLALEARPTITSARAVDNSQPMLARARQRFSGEPRVTVSYHDPP
jgi:SAM-dependent methyltransferase